VESGEWRVELEKNSNFKSRAKRYVNVSSSLALAGAKVAFKDNKAEIIAKAIGSLRGPLVKIAQLLALMPDIIPESYAEELLKLQQNAPVMDSNFVNKRMESELGKNWEKKFLNFDKKAFRGASLGQVHKAIGLDGKAIVCKLQYPDMETVIDADLRQLKLILSLLEMFVISADTKNLYQEISDRLYEEIDYVNEAKNIKLFEKIHKGKEYVNIPFVISKLSSDKLLTMAYLEGRKFEEVLKENQNIKNKIAENLFKTFYIPFYEKGILHADSHTGNYTIAHDGSINLLDFGCIRKFEKKTIEAVVLLYKATLHNDNDMAKEAYSKWGFENITNDLIEVLNVWAKFIYAPFLKDKTQIVDMSYGKEAALKIHKELKKFKNISIPREFVYIDRTNLGLYCAFAQLKAKLNWHQLFNSCIKDKILYK